MSLGLGVNTQPGVYLGVWVNWTKGKVLGSTLTLMQKNGGLLIAFIALFVTFVGSRLWRISCFAIHRICSTTDPQDGVYHHRQIILKNSDNATTGVISWYQLLKAWRRVGRRPYRRLLPIGIFTALFAMAFAAAGLLSSRIASAMGQEVLIRGGHCGVNILGHYVAGRDMNPAVETNPEFFTTLLPFLAQRLVSFSNYALSCYDSNNNTRDCNTFVKPHLPFTSNQSAACPFREDICRLTDGNLLIDTGYLNSHLDFGMNSRPENRFLYRRTTHCAPLVTEGYTRTVNFSDSGFQGPYAQYLYGPYAPLTEVQSNVSYQYPQRSSREFVYALNKTGTAYTDYTLGYVYADVINGSTAHNRAFIPREALRRSDADVTLIFLSRNQVVSPVPIDDPWYSAHQTIPGFRLNYTGWENLTLGGYFADETAPVLGCAKQYQICYPDNKGKPSHCSRLGGKQELYYLLTSLSQSNQQLNSTKWSIMSALTGNELDAFVQTLGAASLTSRYSLVSGVQGPLPNNQWQRDVEHWHAATLASIQGSAVDAATGPSDPKMRQFWAPPENDEERKICHNQKILSNAHANFSVFGLGFTLGLGGLIICVSFLLEPLTNCIQTRYSPHPYSRLEWCTNGTLQIHRLTQEEMGMGTWTGCIRETPTCHGHEKLAGPDITELEHPVLQAHSPDFVEELKVNAGDGEGPEESRIETVQDAQWREPQHEHHNLGSDSGPVTTSPSTEPLQNDHTAQDGDIVEEPEVPSLATC